MERITPQEKKELSYKKDYREPTEGAKKYRRGWRKKKAGEQRSERRKAKQMIFESVHENLLNVQELDFDFIPREKLGRWESMNLREWLQFKAEKKKVLVARKYFRYSYCAEKHESPFSNFLENLLIGNIDNPKEIAILFRDSINGDSKPKERGSFEGFLVKQRHIWLSEYFEKNQAMKTRLEKWIEEVAGLD